MQHVSKTKDIWRTTVSKEDILEAINYATVSLPWTFDRMRYGLAKQKNMNRRLLNIMKGVLNQTLLQRLLVAKGHICEKDWTHYRESDVFDFTVDGRRFDVKTGHVYTEYSERWGREKLSVDLIINNKDYPGPIWKKFFPMGMTLSQMSYKNQKEGYIFGIAETFSDITRLRQTRQDNGYWCAVPWDKASIFFHNKLLIQERENRKKGFQVVVEWRNQQTTLFPLSKTMQVTLFGERDGKKYIEILDIKSNKLARSKGQFSALSCIRCENPYLLQSGGILRVQAENKLKDEIRDPNKPELNLNDHEFEWTLTADDFVNLRMPEDYKVYWIGFIAPKEFFEVFKRYKCWFIPLPGRDKNQEGKLTPNFIEKLQTLDRRKHKHIEKGIEVLIPDFCQLIKGNKFKGGLLISQMKGMIPIGAASYIYPPQPGAFPESALYVLPGDLYRMEDLK